MDWKNLNWSALSWRAPVIMLLWGVLVWSVFIKAPNVIRHEQKAAASRAWNVRYEAEQEQQRQEREREQQRRKDERAIDLGFLEWRDNGWRIKGDSRRWEWKGGGWELAQDN
jgi:hypothetical protein